MITAHDWTFIPKFRGHRHKKDGIVFRTGYVGAWYCYLKWLQENFEWIEEFKYVFPNKEYHFTHGKRRLKFLPDFEVKYTHCLFVETQSFLMMQGIRGWTVQELLRQHPTLKLRVLEKIEIDTIIKNLKLAGIDLRKDLEYGDYWKE